MRNYNINKTVGHYLKLTQELRDGNLSVEQLQKSVERDVQGHIAMFNKNLLTDTEFESYKMVISEYEDLWEEIIQFKGEINKRNNGKAK